MPDVAYAYRVVTLNSGGFAVESQMQIVLMQSLAPVQILNLEFDATTASAALEWSLYPGADFVAYRLIRTVAGEASQVIAEIEERTQTALDDSGLRGNTEYSYEVAVLTKHGAEHLSERRSGTIHALQTMWPLDFDQENVFVRLYVLDADNARIQVFDAAGNYLTQWGSEGSGPGQFIFQRDGDTRAGSVAVDEDGFIYVADVGNKRIQKFAP